MSNNLLKEGFVYRELGKLGYQFLGLQEGRVVGEFALTAAQRKAMPEGFYNVDGTFLGPETTYQVDADGDAVDPTEENE